MVRAPPDCTGRRALALIGNAGEFYVAAELLKRGVVAALAPRNAPGFDILAAKGSKTIRVRVKTKSSQYQDWQWVVKKDGTIFRGLSGSDDLIVLVNLTPETKDLSFYIVPTNEIKAWLVTDFDAWLKAPGKYGRPHSTSNTKRHLNYPRFAERLQEFLHNWDRLWR